jgi:hypothetical protein
MEFFKDVQIQFQTEKYVNPDPKSTYLPRRVPPEYYESDEYLVELCKHLVRTVKSPVFKRAQQVNQLYKDGHSQTEIAKKLGLKLHHTRRDLDMIERYRDRIAAIKNFKGKHNGSY